MHLILYIIALISFAFATVGVPGRISWEGLGLFCWCLAMSGLIK